MRLPLASLFTIGALFLPSADAQKINIEFDQATDFSKFRTFTMREGRINAKAPALNNDIVRKNIETSIEQHLTSRGLLEVPRDADLNVRYTLGAVRKTE